MHDLVPLLIHHGLALVFAFTLAARVGAPVPAAPLLVLAGGVGLAGRISLLAVLLVSILANVLGDAAWYQAGRWRGHRVMKLLCRISLSPDTCVRQSEGILSRWGGSSLVAAKFLPGVSVVAAPMAGALGMSWRRFVAFDALAGLLWSGAYLGVGMAFSRQIDRVLDVMSGAGKLTALVLALVLVAVVALRWARRRRLRADRFAPRISVEELRALMGGGDAPVVIDVRSRGGLLDGVARVPGALTLTLAELPAAAASLPRDRDIVLYCSCPDEVSAVQGSRILAAHGLHRTRALAGGIDAWLQAEPPAPPPPPAGPSLAVAAEAR